MLLLTSSHTNTRDSISELAGVKDTVPRFHKKVGVRFVVTSSVRFEALYVVKSYPCHDSAGARGYMDNVSSNSVQMA